MKTKKIGTILITVVILMAISLSSVQAQMSSLWKITSGTMSPVVNTWDVSLGGDLEMKDDKKLYFDTAKSKSLEYSTAHGEVLFTSENLVVPGDLWIYGNTGADGSGTWEPFIEIQQGVITCQNTNEGIAGAKYFQVHMTDGMRIRTTGGVSARILADNVNTSDKTFQFPNYSGIFITSGNLTDITNVGTLTNDVVFSNSQKIIGGTSTTADLTLQTTSGVGTTGADMHFLTGNAGATEAMTILNNGNVGIGTAGPAQALDVVGNIVNSGGDYITSSNNIRIMTDDGANTVFRGVRATSAWSDAKDTQWFQIGNVNDYVAFTTKSGTVASRMKFQSDSLQIAPGSSSNVPTGLFEVSDNSNGLFNVLSTGNVGIGTTTPGTLLQLAKDGDAYLTLQNLTAENTDGGAETKLIFEDHSNIALAQIQGSHDGTSDDTKGDLIFSTHSGSALAEAMRIDSSGNVGIGTDAPTRLVHAKDNGYGQFYAEGTDSYKYAGYLVVNNVGKRLLLFMGGSNHAMYPNTGAFIVENDDDFVIGQQDGTTRIIAKSTGNIGIGTTTPDTPLHIYDSAATSDFYIESGGAGLGGRIIIEDTDGAGCTALTTLNGTLTAAVIACP